MNGLENYELRFRSGLVIVECKGSLGPGGPGDSEKVLKNKTTSAHPGQG